MVDRTAPLGEIGQAIMTDHFLESPEEFVRQMFVRLQIEPDAVREALDLRRSDIEKFGKKSDDDLDTVKAILGNRFDKVVKQVERAIKIAPALLPHLMPPILLPDGGEGGQNTEAEGCKEIVYNYPTAQGANDLSLMLGAKAAGGSATASIKLTMGWVPYIVGHPSEAALTC